MDGSLSDHRRRRALWTLAASALLLVVAGSFYLWSNRRPEPASPRDYSVGQPTRINTVWLCPLNAPIPVYAAGRVYYPAGHPSAPGPHIQPDACFASEARARRDGYTAASPPPGVVLIDGIYLVPPDRPSLDFCRASAQRLSLYVPCPGLLPSISPRTVGVDCGGVAEPGCGYVPPGLKWFGFYTTFNGPAQYGETPPAGASISGRLHVHAVLSEDSRAGLVVGCSPEVIQPTTPVHGRSAELVICARQGGINAGFVLVRWSVGPATYAAGFYRDTPTNRQLAQVIASNVTLVGPAL